MGHEDFVTNDNGEHHAFVVQRRFSGEEAEAEQQHKERRRTTPVTP
jgi:hypothetical protein